MKIPAELREWLRLVAKHKTFMGHTEEAVAVNILRKGLTDMDPRRVFHEVDRAAKATEGEVMRARYRTEERMRVKFADICDHCKARSVEYSPWFHCANCGENVCDACSIWSDEESGKAVCKRCSTPDVPLIEGNHDS